MLRVAIAVLLAVVVCSQAAAATPGLVYSGTRAKPRVALTFDADMTPAMRQAVLEGRRVHYDARIIEKLRATNTHATLFLTGLWARTYPGHSRSFAADPLFELANHSQTHRGFRAPCYGLATAETNEERIWEVRRARRTIREITGVRVKYFRFPGGCHALADVSLVRQLDHIPVQWDVNSGDAFENDPAVIVQRVLNRVQNGSIVVMHMIGAPNAPATYDAIRILIPELRRRGYQLVTLSELLSGS